MGSTLIDPFVSFAKNALHYTQKKMIDNAFRREPLTKREINNSVIDYASTYHSLVNQIGERTHSRIFYSDNDK